MSSSLDYGDDFEICITLIYVCNCFLLKTVLVCYYLLQGVPMKCEPACGATSKCYECVCVWGGCTCMYVTIMKQVEYIIGK